MTENITLYERNGITGETVETVLTGAEADAWRAQFEISDEEKIQNLRRERDRRLAETDWIITMHKEKGTNIPAAWKTYRQALRDLPANTEDPANPVWPTKPE